MAPSIRGSLTPIGHISGRVSGRAVTPISSGSSVQPYTGAYEYTPTTETQVVPIKGKTATTNIKINPIPNNYGLITWDGSTLRIM